MPVPLTTYVTIGCCVSDELGLLPVLRIAIALTFDCCTLGAFFFPPVSDCFYAFFVFRASVIGGQDATIQAWALESVGGHVVILSHLFNCVDIFRFLSHISVSVHIITFL